MSLGGRLVLSKSVSANLPLYFMSTFEMPKGVEDKLAGIQSNFLLGNREDGKRVHLVRWEEVIKLREEGGLQVVPLGIRNQTFLCNWSWRFGKERDSPWQRLLVARYCVEDVGGWSLGSKVKKESSPVVNVRWRIGKGHKKKEDLFKKNLRMLVGKGDKTLF